MSLQTGRKLMDNITFFNRFTLALFEKLYSSFPTPVEIDVKSIAMSVISKESEFNETFESLSAPEDAIHFLAQEGFLTYKGTYLEGGTFLQSRLTLKGLAILGSTPDSLEGKLPLIDRIRKVLSGGSKEAGAEAVRQITQQAFAAAVAVGPTICATFTK